MSEEILDLLKNVGNEHFTKQDCEQDCKTTSDRETAYPDMDHVTEL